MNSLKHISSKIFFSKNLSFKIQVPFVPSYCKTRQYNEDASNISLEKNNSPFCEPDLRFKENLYFLFICEKTGAYIIHSREIVGVNHVTLLGRAGMNPQLRGSEVSPVVVFTLATNVNYKLGTELRQKTDWHKISVFKDSLRDTVLKYLKKKGQRVYVDGRIVYSEYSDTKGNTLNSTTIVANDIIFLGNQQKVKMNNQVESRSIFNKCNNCDVVPF
ncbi:single-stranded DNA-binding protein, mitochondrial [Caerostris extrusa]|uniref:Single-stranded DNA-binding protein, mitochondrial n=1 Tax=Caerostris extrusa TaxID=172846 RepID=A0AAV4QMJ3_CAEEX|nr:single-stranded DNA-binding protein, mitochondrial [Caerostris extrusa]